MIQLFFKKSSLSENDWNYVYRRILAITEAFPLKLERLESYNGYSPELDKIHYNLTVNAGTLDEHISFWGDKMSFTSRICVCFYKNWNTQISKGFMGNEIDISKPVTWYTPIVFDFSSKPPEANGSKFHSVYLETEGALYRYAILAIGIMLEHDLPGLAFMVAMNNNPEEIHKTKHWLEGVFQEKFDMPLYFDKVRLLGTLKDYYPTAKELVGRIDILYIKQFKRNIQFAIEYIGYQPSLEYYSEVLSGTLFGTFGFSDVLDPWIAATKNLDSTLQLIAKSKQILVWDNENKRNLENAEKYDYIYILKNMLDGFILWSPEQREQLDHFYTNKVALETGKEDLFGNMMRIGGYRIDICPIYATKEQLFEAFMYHDPKNGNEFKEVINGWIEKNRNTYTELIEEMGKISNQQNFNIEDVIKDKRIAMELELSSRMREFARQYAEYEQYFVMEALKMNPAYMDIPDIIETFQEELWIICNKDGNREDIQYILSLPKGEKIRRLRSLLKEKSLSVNQDFEQWVENENDTSVLTSLSVLLSLKIYNRNHAFARKILLMENIYWNTWKTGQKYALDK